MSRAERLFREDVYNIVAYVSMGELSVDDAVDAIAAAARQGGDVQQAPGEAPQSGGDSRIAQPSPLSNLRKHNHE